MSLPTSTTTTAAAVTGVTVTTAGSAVSGMAATNNHISGSTASLATTPATTPTTTPTTLTTTTAKRLGYASPSTSVICEEVFDESCQPSNEEINDYAKLLGIDPVKETHLLYLAKEGLMTALPPEWKICYSEEKCGHYYYNTKTKQSQWDHPLDAVYRELVEHMRFKAAGSVGAVATPIIDYSDDVSQLDSGIRSLQGTDELDNTNTNEMSSPVNNGVSIANGSSSTMAHNKKSLAPICGAYMSVTANGLSVTTGGGGGPSSGPNSNSTTSTSGFSGGVNRFLESRSKNLGSVFMPVKNTRFEVAKTNPQISLAMKFGNVAVAASAVGAGAAGAVAGVGSASNVNAPMLPKTHDLLQVSERKTGFQLSGTGAMFLKSRRQIETSLNQASAMVTTNVMTQKSSNGKAAAVGSGVAGIGVGNIMVKTGAGIPPGVKGILRDSSLTDMRYRIDREDYELGAVSSEENKRVRFNLDEPKLRSSPEEELSSSHKLTQSPEISINNSDNDAEGDDDDLWDEDENDDDDDDDDDEVDGYDCGVCVGSISLDSSGAAATQLHSGSGSANPTPLHSNPFMIPTTSKDKHVRDIRVISVPKAQTIQMLKAQSFSIDLSADREHNKINELARSQSMETAAQSNVTGFSYLDKLKDNSVVKPLYEDTDSDSKGSSVRSFIINKSEQDSMHSSTGPTHPFDLDELNRKHSRDVEQLQRRLQQQNAEKSSSSMRTLKMSTKLVAFLKKDVTHVTDKTDTPAGVGSATTEEIRKQLEKEQQSLLKEERERLEEQLRQEIDRIKRDHEQKLKSIRHEYDLRLTSHQHQLDETVDLQLQEYRVQLEDELDAKRKLVVDEHKARMSLLETNHAEILQDLERDLKSEEDILKKEHTTKLMQMRDKLSHELEMEKQRMHDSGEDRLYEKVRCEKRLLEDKYRCLKEKYIRLKTDVKMSLERRNRRREAQTKHHQGMHTNTNTTTGSETERSLSNKPSIGNSENRSLSYSTSCQDAGGASIGTASAANNCSTKTSSVKPPVPPKLHLASATVSKLEHNPQQQLQQHKQQQSTQQQMLQHARDCSTERSAAGVRKPGIASKYIKHLQVNDDTTSLSQSDTTISNNYTKGRYLPAPMPPVVVSDNGNSDSEAAFACNQENNNNSSARGTVQRKKLFSRTKSASTSRLNSDNNFKIDRPCTPVENLRHQLQKLEDLEDQFPDNTLDTTYHLRYPFTDISNDYPGGGATSSELEFFKHRIHLERDSVRRAKESLRTQRTNFRARQREIKQRHKTSVTRHTLDHLIQEEKELTEMEVNLHRTRALLGEKVIRLRHLEQSLMRIYEKEKPNNMEQLSLDPKDDAATLSDLSSHSSSGFSSTDFASGAGDMGNFNKRKEIFQQESNECIENLEILNTEIREILDILGQKRSEQHGSTANSGMTIPMIFPTELSWSHMLNTNTSRNATNYANLAAATQQHHQQQQYATHLPSSCVGVGGAVPNIVNTPIGANGTGSILHAAPHSIPTLADRLETYRQLAAGRMHTSMGGAIMAANTIVSQSPRAVNYTTSLVERTRDLRNWLRQAKNEHELLTGITLQKHNFIGFNAATSAASNILTGTGNDTETGSTTTTGIAVSVATTTVGNASNLSVTSGGATQTNL